MIQLKKLQEEIQIKPDNMVNATNHFLCEGYQKDFDLPNVKARANAFYSLVTLPKKHIYAQDAIAGSLRGLLVEKTAPINFAYDNKIVDSFGKVGWLNGVDHFAPDYETILSLGIEGLKQKITLSGGQDKDLLCAMAICLDGLSNMILGYAEEAKKQDKLALASICNKVATQPPSTLHEALQLVWFCHLAFYMEGRNAMALGRLDQYLYPFYQSSAISKEDATLLFCNVFAKIHETNYLRGLDTVNICIGGIDKTGTLDATNELSYCILEAVRRCNIPGPNLSARIHKNTSDNFLDECLKVIGTGLGYPALMNDEINIPALKKIGYLEQDCNDYCMVGCIENFLAGKQPPWTDGRFNVPRFFHDVLHDSSLTLSTMQDFTAAFYQKVQHGAKEYMMLFFNENCRYNRQNYQQPFLSIFCNDCIEKGLDINLGGAKYPSAHGACLVGIATVADSLGAVEEVVYKTKSCSLATLKTALDCDFVGYESLQKQLECCPKYGNNVQSVDNYAIEFVEKLHAIFNNYTTADGGAIYIAIASNIYNIASGLQTDATPDGRKKGEPLSDAASPMYGKDKKGATSTLNSVTKPDYTLAACGTVLNQKFSPSMFEGNNRKKLLALVKTYFQKGGQELQINSISREVLLEAMNTPDKYASLVVRVSGFSAYYTSLSDAVKLDILNRTEQG